jgi:hypothetical protein
LDFAPSAAVAPPRRAWKRWTLIGAGSVAAVAATVTLVWLASTLLVVRGTTGHTSTPGRVSWDSPQKIGAYSRDSSPGQRAYNLREALRQRGLTGGVAANYENKSNGSQITVWGAGGDKVTQADSVRELKALFADIADSYGAQGVVALRVSIIPGAVGGVAECGLVGVDHITEPEKNVTACGWVRDGAMVGIYMTGYTPNTMGAIVPTVLAAVVHVS